MCLLARCLLERDRLLCLLELDLCFELTPGVAVLTCVATRLGVLDLLYSGAILEISLEVERCLFEEEKCLRSLFSKAESDLLQLL